MSFPQSKVGDVYNYKVAALLKSKGLPELGPSYDLTVASILADPPQIPSSVTLFQVPVSFDIIASTAHWEMFMECKHKIAPRPISSSGKEWMESVTEFLALHPFRSGYFKDVKYFFFTNSDTTELSESVRALRVSPDSQLSKFAKNVQRTALRKWKGARVPDITVSAVRQCLDDVRILTIEDSKLNAIQTDPEYAKAYHEITRSIGERLSDLPRNLPSSVRILVNYRGKASRYVTQRWIGYSISFPINLIHWLQKRTVRPVQKIAELDFNDLPQGKLLSVSYSREFTSEQVMTALTGSVNDVLESRSREVIVVVSPMNRKLYLVNSKWLLNTVADFRDSQYRFHLGNMQKDLQLELGGDLLKLAVQEAYRLNKSLNLDSSFFVR